MKEMKDLAIVAIVVIVAVVAGVMVSGLAQPRTEYAGAQYAPAMMGAGISSSDSVKASGTSAYWPGMWQDRRIISSSGSVMKSYAPDEATLSFTVETVDKSATKSQTDNAAISAKVRAALVAAGVPAEDIDTSSYTLNQDYRWDEITRKSEIVGYRTTNSITVTLRDITLTGKVIDAAVNAGVNRVDSVYFSLSKDKEAQVRTQLLSEAAATAKSKAERIASGFGAKIARLYTASEGYSYMPVYNKVSYDSYAGAEGAVAPQTPISAGDVKVTVTVDAQFELE